MPVPALEPKNMMPGRMKPGPGHMASISTLEQHLKYINSCGRGWGENTESYLKIIQSKRARLVQSVLDDISAIMSKSRNAENTVTDCWYFLGCLRQSAATSYFDIVLACVCNDCLQHPIWTASNIKQLCLIECSLNRTVEFLSFSKSCLGGTVA